MQETNHFQPRPIYQQVAEQIQHSITNGEFLPESRLPSERELAARFRVSRPAVREAIGSLQNQQLVITRRGSGTYVCADALQRLQQAQLADTDGRADDSPLSTLEVRLLLEPAIARLAARRGQRDDKAEQYLALMKNVKNIDIQAQQALWSECDRLFHRQLAVMTGDALMVRIADEIAKTMEQPLWQRLRDDGIYDEERISLYVAEHQLIYEAIVSGDEQAAAFYVEQHLRRVGRDISTGDASPPKTPA
ncbi:FadR/GntR family transcriptional regulator [Pseudogulbenkiania subflava]|uniref:Transcriptional regulator, GntR family n=1 Tax=Pseudogulbenkiania subflava DSM 22618 TaxID=1123014 RepID=A0A1Y6B9P5_9NEIS|nr:FadR/GntR family transcriptional regulator [Pseudogulbenkiania subflava]SME92015.1 transcriptional regulator, GntR family [Pseudogulbenkiania subflava DSM 22618]